VTVVAGISESGSSIEKKLIRLLDGRFTPAVCGILSSLLMFWVWSGRSFAPDATDEMAYRLQAEIFARGEWTLPARPYPEFFEQEHTFVTPFVAAKYPPGHSLLLVPGVWLGWPPLMPLVLVGVAGALTFLLARELASSWVGVLTWAIWLTTPANLLYLPSYFSEVTTVVLWLLGWLALLKRVRGGGVAWLVTLAVSVAWALITRPLTGLVYAFPTVGTALYHEWRRGVFKPTMLGILVGTAILAIVPLWSWRTTGNWATTPLSLYTRMYDPWDVPGFGLNRTPALRPLPRDLSNNFSELVAVHEQHTPANLPRVAVERLRALGPAVWMGWRLFFAPLFLLGLISLPRMALIGPLAAFLLFAGYLTYAHMSHWIVYYIECLPVVAFVTATGIRVIFTGTERVHPRAGSAGTSRPTFPVASHALRRIRWPAIASHEAAITISLAMAILIGSLPLALWVSRTMREETSLRRAFLGKIACLPTTKNVVFVQYPQSSSKTFLLVANGASLQSSPTWVVFDRGQENILLQRVDPSRAAYTINIATGAISALPAVQQTRVERQLTTPPTTPVRLDCRRGQR